MNILNAGLPKTKVAKDQIAAFKNNFLLPLATYSRSAQPLKNLNLFGTRDNFVVLDAQSDVNLDLLFTFFINYRSPLRDLYETFLHKIISYFPVDAEKTREAALVLINDTMWKLVPTPSKILHPRKTTRVSEHLEEFLEVIIEMFQAGLGGEREAKRAAVFVIERYPMVANKQRALAALERYLTLNVKTFVISTLDLPHYMEQMTTNIIKLNTTEQFSTFLNYASPSKKIAFCLWTFVKFFYVQLLSTVYAVSLEPRAGTIRFPTSRLHHVGPGPGLPPFLERECTIATVFWFTIDGLLQVATVLKR